jgi:hypothetical protein
MEIHKPKFVKGLALEVFVIVVGISLAITAERLVEAARDASEAKRVMTRMIVELARDSSDLALNIEYLIRAEVSDSLLTEWSRGRIELDSDSISVHASNSLLYTWFASSTAEIEALKSSGKLHLIENEEFLVKLLRHYDRYSDFDIARAWAERASLQLLDLYQRNTSMTTPQPPAQPWYQMDGVQLGRNLRGNQLLENYLQHKKYIDLEILRRTRLALARAGALLAELRSERGY